MIDRDVILDLLPLYRAGLGSPATRALVAAWLAEHPGEAPGAEGPRDDAWRAMLARARRASRRRRYLFAAAVALSALCLALRIDFEQGRLAGVHLLAADAPLAFAPLALAAMAAWIGYWREKVRDITP